MRLNAKVPAATSLALLLLVVVSLTQSTGAAATGRAAAASGVDYRSREAQPAAAAALATREPSDDPANGTWQNDFLSRAEAIRQAYPDDFAEAVVGDDLHSGMIGFAGSAPVGALEQLEEFGGVRVVENVGYTEKSISDVAAQVYSLAKAELGPDSDLNTYYDGVDGNFHVKYSSAVEQDDTRLQQSLSAQLVLPGNKRLVVDSDPSDMLAEP